ncbi:YebC/PmpR family DNA-binding transcriptional regulator, partial [Furfurilactobacillus sp.]
AVRDALQEKGFDLDTAEITMIPENVTKVPSDKAKQYVNLIDELSDNDDVSDVYEAAEVADEDLAE